MTRGGVERRRAQTQLVALSVLALAGLNGFFALGLWESAQDRLGPLWDGTVPAPTLAGSRHLYYQLLTALVANVVAVAAMTIMIRRFRHFDETCGDPPAAAAAATALAADRQLADAIESLANGFVLFDRDERIVLFNRRYHQMLGSVGAVITPGLSYESLLRAVAERGLVSEACRNPDLWVQTRLSQHRKPTEEAVEQELTEGEWVLSRTFPTSDGGRVQIRADISHLKRQQAESLRQELLLRTTIENTVQGLCVFDADRRLVLSNRNWLGLLNLPARFAQVGTSLAEIIRWRAMRGDYGPDEADQIAALSPADLEAMDDHAGERELPNGTVLEVLGVPMPGGGRLTTYTDITVRRNAERALRQKTEVLETTLQSVDQGIAMFDNEFRLIAANHRYFQLLGYPEALFQLGTRVEAFVRYRAEHGALGQGDVEEIVAERLQIAKRLQPYHYETMGAGGAVIEARRVPTAQGGFVTTYTDISDRQARENEMRAARAAAERTSEIKSLFLAKMSHELRTPFNAIIGFAEIIANRSFGEDREAIEVYASYAGEILESARHLLDMVNNILDISKIEAGRMAVSIDRFDLLQTLNSCLSMMRELSRSQGVTLSLETSDPLPEARADERAVKQIITNLLSNALKFTPAGGSIALSARPVDTGGFEIAVSDTGVGIPSDQIDRVLQPFEQVDNRYSRSTGGTGLGLALVKGLVDLHGGSIRVDSVVGHGTTVTASFPAMPRDSASRPAIAESL